MRFFIFAAIAALFINGCSTDCDGSFYFNGSSFSASDEIAIKAAALDVNAFTGRTAITIGPGGRCPIDEDNLIDEGGDAIWRGLGRIEFDLNRLRSRCEGQCGDDYSKHVTLVATHEFLHSLGMKHHDGPGVMNHHPKDDAVLSQADKDECIRVGACSP